MPPSPAHKPATERAPEQANRPAAEKARFRRGRFVALLLWTVAVATAFAFYSGAIKVPDHLNPMAPLAFAAEPNLLTPWKLSRARGESARCLAALEQTGMQYDQLPDRATGDGCGFENAVRLRSAAIGLGRPLPLSCPMALSLAMWERHALQPVTQAHFGQRVASIDNLGSYACRNVNRGEGAAPEAPSSGAGSRSRHATANALDVSGFTLANGKRISVQGQWQGEGITTPRTPKRSGWTTCMQVPANTSKACWARTTTPCTGTTFIWKPAATACAADASNRSASVLCSLGINAQVGAAQNWLRHQLLRVA